MKRPLNEKGTESEQFRKLFIGGLDYRTTDETLKNFYAQWGEIVDVVVMKHSATQKSRGFGFVTYSDMEMVDKAMANRPHKIDGREVDSKRAVPRDESGRPDANQNVKKMFVGGLKDQPEEDLREYFSKFGKIINVNIVTDPDGKRKGFCFIEFDDYDPVDRCVLYKNHNVSGKSLTVKKAIPKDSMGKMGGGRGGRDSGRGSSGRGSKSAAWASGGGQADIWGNSQQWGSSNTSSQYGGGGGYSSSWDAPQSGGGGSAWGNSTWNERSSFSSKGSGGGWGGQGGGYSQQGGGGGYGSGSGGGPVRNNYLSQSRSTPYGGGGGGGGYGGGSWGGNSRY